MTILFSMSIWALIGCLMCGTGALLASSTSMPQVRDAGRCILIGAILWAIACLIDASDARADRWTAADSASQAVVVTALGADYLQTRQIIHNARYRPEMGHLERNPVMGERGERVPAELYFLGVAALHTVAARALPQPWRRISQVALLAVQVKAIGTNMSAGYSITF